MSLRNFAIYALLAFAFAGNSDAAPPNRVVQALRTEQTLAVRGNIHPRAQRQYDQGPVDSGLQMDHVLLVLKPSGAQQADLEQLLAAQQNPSSPNFHQWLAPEAFADRFGLSTSDHSKVTAWLQSQGLRVQDSGRGRNWIAFSGTSGQIGQALHTSIHRYVVNGESHIANSTEPSIPAALADVVGGFIGLDDFHLKPMISKYVKIGSAPDYTSASHNHYLAPEDYATIYDLAPLYAAGFDGTGQAIAIVGASDVSIADIRAFRSRFGLPANDPRFILYGEDPGTNGAEIEGDLDLEWAGAIAPKAAIYYFYGPDPLVAAIYAINTNLAPIISISYGNCEIEFPTLLFRTIFQQGNAQGITTLSASGDSGAAGCDAQGLDSFATRGQTATFPSNLPEITGVGGTRFDDANGTFWGGSNDSAGGSAVSYIPEIAWNESAPGFGLGASGGGFSSLIAKPDWQTGAGVPHDGARDIPDVAMSAAVHDGYLVMNGNSLYVVGGTSASAPSLSGIVALVNQYQVSKGYQKKAGLGNINPQLYRLAKIAPSSFHDITSGDNVVPCAQGTPDCIAQAYGYETGIGYDLVTGLGSIDGNNLVTQWNTASQSVQMTLTATPAKVTVNDNIQLTATVVDPNGGSPTGTVNFLLGSTSLGSAVLSTAGSATVTFAASALASGTGTVSAVYSGDATYSGGSASVRIQITIPTGVSAIVPTVNPSPVFAAPADAQGLSWQTIVRLTEVAGVPSTLTGFTIDGQSQPLAQYFPSTSIIAKGSLSADLILRNLAYPVTKTLGFTGIDSSGATWTRSVPVTFLGPQVFQNFNLSAIPLTMTKNANADASCQWSQQLILDETGGFSFRIVGLVAGSIDITDRAQAIFGTMRLAPYGSLQGTLCWSGITPPATNTVLIALNDEFGNTLQTQLNVSFAGPVANPVTLSTSQPSVTLNGSTAELTLNLSDKTQPWTATVSPGNRATGWLTLSQYAGTGPAQMVLTTSGVGFEPGVYRALITFQSPNAVPQTITVPVMFVWGAPGGGSTTTSISWAANAISYKTTVSPGQMLAVSGTQLGNSVQRSATLPLPFMVDGASATINGLAAPLYYTSPGQLNIQVPYEVGAGPAVLGVNNHGQIAAFQLQVTPAAPAIVVDTNGNILPTTSVVQGKLVTMYMTGDGDVTPALVTGVSPSAGTPATSLPHPRLPVTVTVGGVQAFLQFVGIPPGVVGLTQVNIIVPAAVPAGLQPVVVTVGGVASPPGYVMVQTGS
jgi:uncharacterized protein (TIGR03437 family)